MRPRVSEIRKVTELLDREWESVNELAEVVTQTMLDLVEERDQWCVIMNDDRLGMFVFGPYETEGKAKKAIGSTIVSPGPSPAKGYVRRLVKEKE